MSKFKTVSAQNPARRVFADGFLKVNSVDENKNYKVSLMLISEGRNRNGWVYEGLERNLNQFVNIPLLYSVIDGKVANSHDFELKKDKDGETYASFIGAESEHIAGWISDKLPNGDFNAYMTNIDGKQWVCVREAFLPAYYNKEFIDELEKNGGQMSISIETLVYKNRIEGDTEFEMDWRCVGVTILGRGVAPAVAGANIRKLSAYGEELRELKLRVASYYEQETQIKEPQTQKQNQNSRKGETRTMAKVRKVDDLRSMFNGYTVLGVKGQTVALLNEKGRCCSYTFLENEDTVVPERIAEIAVNSVFGEGENAIEVSADELVGSVTAQLNSTKSALDKATAENAELTAKINAMTEAERKRRRKVVEKAIKDRLEENRKEYENDIEKNLCDDMLTDDSLGKYAEMEEDGDFCGDSAAVTEVDARCMRKIREAKKAKNNAAQNRYIWENGGESDEEEPKNGVAAVLNEYGATKKS